MTRYDLVAVGEVMFDVLAPPPADRPRHAPVELRAGGSAANAARAAAAGGRSTLVVGCVGDDDVADLVRRDLHAAGIELSLAVVPGARTGRTVYSGAAVTVERGANAAFAPEHVPAGVRGAAVLVSGYQLLRADSGAGAAAAFGLGGLVGVDLGGPGVVRSFGPERTREAVAPAAVVFGSAAAVDALGPLDGPLVVTTLGADGARADGVEARPARRVEGEAIGAGDAFAAAVLLALADDRPVREALEHGCAAGLAVAVESAR